MKTLAGAAILIVLFATSGRAPVPRAPVLVELFTSEGCSSCPSADALLEALQRDQPIEGADIIPLGLHVDYFDHLGWKDAFSSAAFTARQRRYSQTFGGDNMYTPQIVVDGREAVAANDPRLVARTIASAAARAHLPLRMTARAAADRLQMTIDLPAAPPNAEKIQVMAAITQDGLVSSVNRGENRGRTLHHVAVARTLQVLQVLGRAPASVERQLPIGSGWGQDGLKAAIWLQGEKSRVVYAAAVAPVTR